MAKTTVPSQYIADNAITTAKIAANAITAAQIAGGAIVSVDLGANSITITSIAGNAVGSSEIAKNAVGSSEIAANAVGNSEIAANAVDSAELVSGSIDTVHIADSQVTNAKLANSSVTLNSNSLSLGGTLTLDTDDISEGATNLYFSNERVDDRVNGLLTAGTGITLTYDDGANTLTIAGSAQYGDSDVESYLDGGTSTPTFASATVTGNITVSGTVDGRDLATDGTKLDGIESGATADQTQSEINALGITATGLSGTPNITVGTISAAAITTTAADQDIDMDASASGQIRIDGNGYNAAIALGSTTMAIYNNSASRSLTLGTNETARITIGGAGGVSFNNNNLTSVGTIGSGAITSTGAIQGASFSDGTISGITFIDEDSFATNSATRIPTQQSIKAYVDAQVAGVVDSAPAALDTLNELAAALGDDANFSTTTSTALGNRLRVDTAAQGLTGTQQANAITNLGITATKAELNYVDGVTSNIQTQLDTKLASSSYTAADVLTKIKTVDGAGSGLDADLLDGISSASFLRSDAADSASGAISLTSTGNPLTLNAVVFNNTEPSGYYTGGTGTLAFDENFYSDTGYGTGTYDPTTVFTGNNGGGLVIKNEDGWGAVFTSQNTRWASANWDNLTIDGNQVWHAGNDGAGSGLDADTVDSLQASQFLRSDASDTMSGNLIVAGNITSDGSGSAGSYLQIDTTDATYARLENAYSSADVLELCSMGAMQFSIDTNNNSTGKDFVWKHNGLGTTGSVLATLYGDSGDLQITGDLYVPDQIIHEGDANTYMQFNAADTWRVVAGGSQKLVVNTSGVFVSNGVLDLNDNSLNDVGTINMTNNGAINLWTSASDTGTGSVNIPRGGHITFYGNSNVDHSIGSRDASGAITDDLRISSYGAIYIDLDANNNNTSTADFVIGRHGSGTGTIGELYRFSGEYSNLDFKGNGNTTTGGNISLGSTQNNATKFTSITSREYTNDTETEGFTIIGSVATTERSVIVGGGYLEQNSANKIKFYTTSGTSRTGTERMRIIDGGQVLINTTVSNLPSDYATVGTLATTIIKGPNVAATDNALFVQGGRIALNANPNSDTTRGYIQSWSGGLYVWNRDNSDMVFGVNDTNRMSIQWSDGRIKSQPTYDNAAPATHRDVYVENSGQLGYASSVRAHKTNITDYGDASWLYSVNPKTFNYRKKNMDIVTHDGVDHEVFNGTYSDTEYYDTLQVGFIAEDVEQYDPNLCFYNEVEDEDGNVTHELAGIHYKSMVAPMLKLIQEQKALIDNLTARIEALET